MQIMLGYFGTDRNWLPSVVTLTGWQEFPWSTSRSCKPSIRSAVICYVSISCFIDRDVARLRWPKSRSVGGELSGRICHLISYDEIPLRDIRTRKLTNSKSQLCLQGMCFILQNMLHVSVVVYKVSFFFFPCGAAAQRGPWPPHSRGF